MKRYQIRPGSGLGIFICDAENAEKAVEALFGSLLCRDNDHVFVIDRVGKADDAMLIVSDETERTVGYYNVCIY